MKLRCSLALAKTDTQSEILEKMLCVSFYKGVKIRHLRKGYFQYD